MEANDDRSYIYCPDAIISGFELGFHCSVRTIDGGKSMNWLYIITGLIVVALFIYLVLALLKPEWFG
jgi:K+-transporting ATPase KdpF subunit